MTQDEKVLFVANTSISFLPKKHYGQITLFDIESAIDMANEVLIAADGVINNSEVFYGNLNRMQDKRWSLGEKEKAFFQNLIDKCD